MESRNMAEQNKKKDQKELAYLYDLYFVPQWREAFDRLVDEEVKLPKGGKLLDAECGTGGYAVDLALRVGKDAEVTGVDASEERLALARGKAVVKKVKQINFQSGKLQSLGLPANEFDWIVADASLTPASEIGAVFAELQRVAKPGAPIALKLTTRGSFDEFFSVFWETLNELDLIEYTPQLETLITERLTASDAEQLAAATGLKQVRSVTQNERLEFPTGAEFLVAPLIETNFLGDWLALLPDDTTRARVLQKLPEVIDRARAAMDFDVSIKATLIIAQK
jgi:ubiquinone/menaquinone biosynthesis C-methylase UbiE